MKTIQDILDNPHPIEAIGKIVESRDWDDELYREVNEYCVDAQIAHGWFHPDDDFDEIYELAYEQMVRENQ